VRSGEDSPFLRLHREMNRLSTIFSAVLISHHSVRIASSINYGNWPGVEVSETDKEIKITAELPGLDEEDIQVELANGHVCDPRLPRAPQYSEYHALYRAGSAEFQGVLLRLSQLQRLRRTLLVHFCSWPAIEEVNPAVHRRTGT
jgi:hypothetical protein